MIQMRTRNMFIS